MHGTPTPLLFDTQKFGWHVWRTHLKDVKSRVRHRIMHRLKARDDQMWLSFSCLEFVTRTKESPD